MHTLFRLMIASGVTGAAILRVIFAIACVPLISAIGCAVDYCRATQLKSKLLAASDAASVGSIAKVSPAFIYAGAMTTDGTIPVGVTDATNIFRANIANETATPRSTASPRWW